MIEKDIELPDWFTDLVDAIKGINTEAITDPINELYGGPQIEGYTIPPFQCFICGEKFTVANTPAGEDVGERYLKHLLSHITAFTEGWFPEES